MEGVDQLLLFFSITIYRRILFFICSANHIPPYLFLKVKSDHRSKFSNLGNWKEEAWKYQGFNGIRTNDLRDIGAMLDQLSCEATLWERAQFVEFSQIYEFQSREDDDDVKEIGKHNFRSVLLFPMISNADCSFISFTAFLHWRITLDTGKQQTGTSKQYLYTWR